jgi:hypothetical protein
MKKNLNLLSFILFVMIIHIKAILFSDNHIHTFSHMIEGNNKTEQNFGVNESVGSSSLNTTFSSRSHACNDCTNTTTDEKTTKLSIECNDDNKINEYQKENTNLLENIKRLEERLIALESENSVLKSRIQYFEHENEVQKSRIRSFESKNRKVLNKISEAFKERASIVR